MSNIGERLKQIREKKHLSIDDVAAGTGIRAQYLEALENGEYSNIPGDVFIKGFIRNYGNYLELDGNSLVEEYKQGCKTMAATVAEAVATPEENVQAAVDAAEERNLQRTKPKASLGHGIKNAWEDFKSFIYDNIYETVDDEDEEEETAPQQTAASPASPPAKEESAMEATRKIKLDAQAPVPPPVKVQPRQAAPVQQAAPHKAEPAYKEKSSFFNFKAFAGMFIVLILVFFGIMAYFMFSGKGPATNTQTTKVNTGVKSAHSTENTSTDAATTKEEDKKQTQNKDAKAADNKDAKAADSKDAKTTDKAKTDNDTVAAGDGDGVTLEITYKKPVWTQVTADGKVIEAATIPAGSTKVYKGSKEIKLNIGAIRDVVIKVNGKEVPYGEKEWGTANKVYRK